jgi:hypothetical protein
MDNGELGFLAGAPRGFIEDDKVVPVLSSPATA